MKTLGKRLERLERSFAARIDEADDWRGLENVRDAIHRHAQRQGEPRSSEIRTKLDALGPAGLWWEAARGLLANQGFVQTGGESFAETVARSLGIETDELRVRMAQGQIGSVVLQRFGDVR